MGHYDEDTALVVVDVQNDFADPAGSLYVRRAPGLVDEVNEEIASALEGGAIVVYTQDWHPPDTPHFEKDGGVWPVHCVRDTWGAQLHPELRVEGEVVRKGTGGEDGYSGFTVRDPMTGEEEPTRLDELLRERGVRRVVVAGLCQDVCVKETALDAIAAGYETVVPESATRPVEVEPGDEERAWEEMRQAGIKVA